MKRFTGKCISLILCLVMLVSVLPADSLAAEAVEQPEADELICKELKEILGENWNIEDAQEAYLNYVFGQTFSGVQGTLTGEQGAELYASDRLRDHLSVMECAMYDALKAMALQAESGKETTTEIKISISKTLGKSTWTAEELGVKTLLQDGVMTEEAKEALRSMISYNPSNVIRAALRDCPYEFFWAENFFLYGKGETSYAVKQENGVDVAWFSTDILQIHMPVSDSYSNKNGQKHTVVRNGVSQYYYTSIDTEKTVLPRRAAANAAKIVEEASALSDWEKLHFYMEKICALNVYNLEAAAASSGYPQRDPWQIVYVFDEDPSTNVVCEGYAKAFQYLCELTSFDSSQIYTYSVTGELYQGSRNLGGHMWNVLHMDDGSNYLVDLTNCDGDVLREWLFAVGANSGDVEEGYTFTHDNTTFTYVYYPETTGLYTEDELTLVYAAPYTPGHVHTFVYESTIEPGCETKGYDRYICTGCDGEERRDWTETVGHSYGKTEIIEPGCITAGSQTRICSRCQKTDSKAIKPLGHAYTYDYTVAPTCTERGYDVSICDRCQYQKKDNYTDKLSASVIYRTHVQTYGDQNAVKDGAVSGTYGESKRLEGIWIDLDTNADLGIRYTTHVQTYGWLDNTENGAMSGTSGEAKRLEAIMIELYGKDAELFDVYYRVHAQSYGWLGWVRNGAPAGTAGYAKRLEGIQIVVAPKGTFRESAYANVQGIVYDGAEGYISTSSDIPAMDAKLAVSYRTHVQGYGWLNETTDGKMNGTSGEGKRMEAIEIRLKNSPYSGDIEYCTHVQSYGWQTMWAKNGALSGTSGEAKRLEAVRIRLTGEMKEKYDIYYRVHAQKFGWLGWARNGEEAGTAGFAYRLEAIQIVLVEKGQPAPDQVDGIASTTSATFISNE